jgi:hypothetical protein
MGQRTITLQLHDTSACVCKNGACEIACLREGTLLRVGRPNGSVDAANQGPRTYEGGECKITDYHPPAAATISTKDLFFCRTGELVGSLEDLIRYTGMVG